MSMEMTCLDLSTGNENGRWLATNIFYLIYFEKNLETIWASEGL